MPGGNPHPRLPAEVPRKPPRIFLQVRHRDLNWDQPEHNWLAENLHVAAALAQAGCPWSGLRPPSPRTSRKSSASSCPTPFSGCG